MIRDSASPGLSYVPGSAVVPGGTAFASGSPISSWTIASIGAGQSFSLTFQATATTTGVLYNSAMIPGDTARICTSVPVQLYAGDEYALTIPAGRASYHWYRNDVLIPGQTSNVLLVAEPGSYRLGIDETNGLCPTLSCCPFLVESTPSPAFLAATVAATCRGNSPQPDGQLVLSAFGPALAYQYSLGNTFDSTASLSGASQPILINRLITNTLPNPLIPQAYTIRVTNRAGCYTDLTVTLAPTAYTCPTTVCAPIAVRRKKGTK